MSTDAIEKSQATPAKTSITKKWMYGLILLLVVVAVVYFAYLNRKDHFSNHDYYRVLYEASNTFNESLIKLDRMHSFEESVPAIRSLLPSYKRLIDTTSKTLKTSNVDETDAIQVEEFTYTLMGKDLIIEQRQKDTPIEADPIIKSELDFEDILPMPKQGFSQYLFADEKGKVLATAGKETAISIVDLTSINQQIARQSKQFQLSLSETGKAPELDKDLPLPSYSSHVDMDLSYGEFRIFIFPFTPATQVKKEDGKALEQLFLVGLIPTNKLSSNKTNHWNTSLLVVSLVSLFFMWNLLRLILLPYNQSITRSFRNATILSSYLFYIVIFALALAYFQKAVLQESKDQTAIEYGKALSVGLERDLSDVFNKLSNYRAFYLQILETLSASTGQNVVKPDKLSPEDRKKTADTLFKDNMKKALAHLNQKQCTAIDDKTGLRAKFAAISGSLYRIAYRCDYVIKAHENIDVEFDRAAQMTLLDAYLENKPKTKTLDFYAGNTSLELNEQGKIDTFVDTFGGEHTPGKVLSVFAVNGEGNSTLPSVYFQESNAEPATFNLSHRDYYKKVRDQKGWDLDLEVDAKTSTFKNVYIQRLLNVNNGTRGTTISLPIVDPLGNPDIDYAYSHYVIGADVLLPSLSLAQQPPEDFVFMVAERTTGDILFHSNSSRSLVENLYFTGNSTSDVGQWLKAGLDNYPELGNTVIKGHYHGQAGRFALSTSPVDNWAIVIFYPDDSLHALMTNQFLYVSVTFIVIMLALTLAIFGLRHYISTSALKRKFHLPENCNIRIIMLLFSLLISVNFCLFYLGETINLKNDATNWSTFTPVVGILVLAYIVHRVCTQYFANLLATDMSSDFLAARKGSTLIISSIIVVTFAHLAYLKITASIPMYSLAFHYQQMSCNWLNHERKELINTGLSRYPNSITNNRENPLDLLPIEANWLSNLKGPQANENKQDIDTANPSTLDCDDHLKHIRPEDYPRLSSIVGVTYMWKWINGFLSDETNFSAKTFNRTFTINFKFGLFVVALLTLSTLIFGWLIFNVKILWNRLYCPDKFLHHIARMTKSVTNLSHDERSDKLTIECDTIKLNGIGLALLLRNMSLRTPDNGQQPSLLDGFDQLYNMSPCLQKFSADNAFLPNLKLNLSTDNPEHLLDVQIWDIEICLEKLEFRQLLLDLIMELKSLVLSKTLHSLTIITGFHSLQRVKMKDPFSNEHNSLLEHAEYLSWADCLMDFKVLVPNSFREGLDLTMLKDEVQNFPELQFLNPTKGHLGSEPEIFWRSQEDEQIESKWTTINYILLNADALYRFKWESCSSAEKLALFNLAKHQRLNPTNTQMIEHLAINGLIRVRKGHIDIINRSFRHFVLHAETADTLNNLVKSGEAGTWKNYRLPLGIIILLVIGGIALTSGESVYIIAASVAGILGTVASVTNSASLLKGQFRE